MRLFRLPYIFLSVCFLFLSSETFAQDPPRFLLLHNPQDNSALQVKCDYPLSKGGTMNCHFAQLRVSQENEETLKEDLAKIKNALQKASDKEIMVAARNACSSIKEWENWLKPPRTSERQLYTMREVNKFKRLCACKDLIDNDKRRACVVQSAEAQANGVPFRCTFSSFPFDAQFTKITERKWMSNSEPTGLCNVVVNMILERDKLRDSMWTYTQTRLSAGSDDPDLDKEICDNIEVNKPVTFTWLENSEIVMNCQSIVFSN